MRSKRPGWGEERREGFEEKGMGGGRRDVRGVKGESDGERGEGRRTEKGIGKGMEERDGEEKGEGRKRREGRREGRMGRDAAGEEGEGGEGWVRKDGCHQVSLLLY